ncbi:MAG: hypothetical protein HOW73_49855, partial [Polyangiaceae bacterium]|nr:hypothetical protein [Polyangiaceae bacterium]
AADGGGGAGTGGIADGGAGGAGPATPCEAICGFFSGVEETQMCGFDGAACLTNCEMGFDQTPVDCHDEAIAYNDCLMEQPPEAFNCTDMVFTLTGDACDEPFNALNACVNGG